ncbi:serine hydrolase domain-containing protein [Amycolatopsis sp.]|uniref:serine hydrolase domain-containing protein n=1 Tax=Amycolatopsis sp. TaxID=37632 RepID=UPI002B87800F|nr:serine hydrolase domain-containing protein [Amycolatopsis sp.]HVV13175.1 serine hydrolase domain-containing protein [Amycolatopsis sp.]
MHSGLAKTRLDRMHDVLAGHVERGELPGLVTLVARHGETHVDVLGKQAVDGVSMQRETIFRISSMTKPVTAVGAMILVEECRLRLDDPVDDLLPELADRRVLTSIDAPLDDTVPARRAITLRDLLTFRLGFGQLTAAGEVPPILRAAEEAQVAVGPPAPANVPGPDEWLRRLGELPLMYQPGERWLYHTGADLLGVLISRATGQSLQGFLRERLFEPLGMRDTHFGVPPYKASRFATSYWMDGVVYDEPDGQWAEVPEFQSGGGGLVSTVDDYLAFGSMLLHKGKHGGERILARPTVELMTTDQLTAAQKAASGFFPGYFDSRGWGFGMSVVTARTDIAAVPGTFGWDGGLGTSWLTDPSEDLVALMFSQRAGFPQFSPHFRDFWTGVYQAIDD